MAKEIKYADSEQLFPWRPKRWDAQPKMVMIFGAIQLALMAFAFQVLALHQIYVRCIAGFFLVSAV